MISPSTVRFGPAGRLYGVVHRPSGAPRGGLVICAPFGEEAKCAYRPLYEMADLAAARGWAVLRFDYLGTGNSEGGFEDFTLEQAQRDLQAAVAYLREQGPESIGILGLGLGASLALEPAAEGAADFLVMWQPIADGEEFCKLNIKRQLLRQMLTHGKAKGTRSQGNVIDLDGYPLLKTTAEQLKKLKLLEGGPVTVPPALIVQISHTQNPAPELRALAGICTPTPQTSCIRCEPFWKRIGFVECSAVYEATLRWLEGVEAGRGQSQESSRG